VSDVIYHVRAGILDVAYRDMGPKDGKTAILLHGFPYDIHAYDEVAEILGGQEVRCLVPYLRGYGPTRFIAPDSMRSGQQAALGVDLLAFMDALAIPAAILGGYDWGGRAACIVAALWPDRAQGLVSCGQGYNIQDIADAWKPAPPEEETRYWYQYYFNTRRGVAGLTENRAALCRHIWELWSPSWVFTDRIFEQTATSFDNPDFVDVVIHSYRHRFGDVAGDPDVQPIEDRLAARPPIAVPTVILQGADDGVDPPTIEDIHRPHFDGAYRREIIPGVGHNLPQEAPEAFAAAVMSLAHCRASGFVKARSDTGRH
jgi:pimeloyl-ACP methyl ester carboxylesterase